ncbi:MAG: hypothetical protein ACKO96_11165, partial [Flammeovirgaceae bacterium]
KIEPGITVIASGSVGVLEGPTGIQLKVLLRLDLVVLESFLETVKRGILISRERSGISMI